MHNTTDIQDVQRVQLKMLKAIGALCEKYNLRYILYCGTLLGAVRHKGFIPWDDDIDIAMPLPDYRQFLHHADELEPAYVVQSPHNTPHSTVIWAKVYANGTTYMPIEAAGIDVHWGISIDIYPIIGSSSKRLGYEIQAAMLGAAKHLRFVEYAQLFSIEYPAASATEQKAKQLLSKLPFPARRVLSDALVAIASRNPDKTRWSGTIDAVKFTFAYDREDWNETIMGTFEDGEFRIPTHYDKMLSSNYGDYMTLPPVEKRVGHFQTEKNVIRDAFRDFREYRKELLPKLSGKRNRKLFGK